MREAFRSNEPSLLALSSRYDWVLNAKPTLLSVKLQAPAEEFAGMIDRVGKFERNVALTEPRVDKAIVE
jgi:hypothetical protein